MQTGSLHRSAIALWIAMVAYAGACSAAGGSGESTTMGHSMVGACANPVWDGSSLAVVEAHIGCRSDRFATQPGIDVVLGGFLAGRPIFFAPADAAPDGAKWGLRGAHVHEHLGVDATSITDGRANTRAIVAAVLADLGLDNEMPNAARLCAERGDGGWYLPAKNELAVLWESSIERGGPIDLPSIGIDTSGHWYWTSTERYRYMAAVQSFRTGRQDAAFKRIPQRVRCIRSD